MDTQTAIEMVNKVDSVITHDNKDASTLSAPTSKPTPTLAKSPNKDAHDVAAGGNSADSKLPILPPTRVKKPSLPKLPMNFEDFQQMIWTSKISLDDFDGDGVPFSPNIHKMWLRHCHRHETMKEEDESKTKTDEDLSKQPTEKFGFHYRPELGDVVYDDGSGYVVPAPGTWILDDKNKIVSGSDPMMLFSPMKRRTMPMIATPGPDGVPILNPFINYAMNASQEEEEGNFKRMRNRCYSDCQENDEGFFNYLSKTSNDSGIDVEGELDLPATPLPEEFKPSLNSTPQQRSEVNVDVFLKEFQMLRTCFKEGGKTEEDGGGRGRGSDKESKVKEGLNVESGKSPVADL